MFQRLDRALGLGHPHTLEDFFCDDLACSRDLPAGRKGRLLYLLHLDGFKVRGARLAERKHLPKDYWPVPLNASLTPSAWSVMARSSASPPAPWPSRHGRQTAGRALSLRANGKLGAFRGC